MLTHKTESSVALKLPHCVSLLPCLSRGQPLTLDSVGERKGKTMPINDISNLGHSTQFQGRGTNLPNLFQLQNKHFAHQLLLCKVVVAWIISITHLIVDSLSRAVVCLLVTFNNRLCSCYFPPNSKLYVLIGEKSTIQKNLEKGIRVILLICQID